MAKKNDTGKAGVKDKPVVTESDVDSAVAAANIVGAELCVFIGGGMHHIGKVDEEGNLVLLKEWRVQNSDARLAVRKTLELRNGKEPTSDGPLSTAALAKLLGLLIPQLTQTGTVGGGDPEYPFSVSALGQVALGHPIRSGVIAS